MTSKRIRGAASFVWRVLRGTWGGAVVFLALKALDNFVFLVLLANMCDSRFRFMPELPDRLVVVMYDAAVVLWIALFVIGAIILLVPIIPLCRKQLKNASAMFAHSLAAVFVGALLFFPELVLGLITGDLYEVCRENVMCNDPGKRKPQPRLHQRSWEFCNGRYSISDYGGVTSKYWLCDSRGRYDTDHDMWHTIVLLEGVAQWEEKNERLYLLTKKDERHVLSFSSGIVHRYPGGGDYRQSKEADEIFSRLEGKNHFLDKYNECETLIKKSNEGSDHR